MSQFLVISGAGITPDRELRGRSVIASKYKPKNTVDNIETALSEARVMAAKEPQTPIYIFQAVEVVETTAPTYQRKKFNDRGELLPEDF